MQHLAGSKVNSVERDISQVINDGLQNSVRQHCDFGTFAWECSVRGICHQIAPMQAVSQSVDSELDKEKDAVGWL